MWAEIMVVLRMKGAGNRAGVVTVLYLFGLYL